MDVAGYYSQTLQGDLSSANLGMILPILRRSSISAGAPHRFTVAPMKYKKM